MNVLEKILEEIEERIKRLKEADNMCRVNAERNRNFESMKYFQSLIFATERAESIIGDIIRSHMDEAKDTNVPSNVGWIPVEERLPEANERVLVTVKHSRWIADFDSNWVPEEDKTQHPETRGTYIGYINDDGIWIFIDEEGQENVCDKEFGQNLERVYDVVTHWQPRPKPYKPKKDIEDSGARS